MSKWYGWSLAVVALTLIPGAAEEPAPIFTEQSVPKVKDVEPKKEKKPVVGDVKKPKEPAAAGEVKKEKKAAVDANDVKKEKKDPANAKPAAGEPGSASYFGVKTEGDKFVFVLDNSNSMAKARFDTACYELMTTIRDFRENQQFYVILFSDTAYPLYYPASAKDFVPATQLNKDKLAGWLKSVECVLHTNAHEAMARALAAKPDAIYLLSDGAFTDDTTEFLLKRSAGKTKVYTLGFKEGDKGADAGDLSKIAAHYGGRFTAVGVNPMFKNLERPKHSTKDGVWGTALEKMKNNKK